MSDKKITDLNHLKLVALKGKAFTTTKVDELTEAMADAIDRKQDVLTGTENQTIGFDAEGNAVPVPKATYSLSGTTLTITYNS